MLWLKSDEELVLLLLWDVRATAPQSRKQVQALGGSGSMNVTPLWILGLGLLWDQVLTLAAGHSQTHLIRVC